MNDKSFFYRFATSRVAVAVSIVVFLLLTAAWVFRLIEWWLFASIVIVSILGFVIYGLVRDVLALRRDQGFERGMDAHAETQQKKAQAGERASIAEMHERWKQGIEKLRASRAGRGSKALYYLPWYLIIGKPGTGKTCAIKNSGLHFPLGTPKTAGTGGTRNCDWFFAEEAILLDTAGRFTSSEDESADRREWIEFLGLVRKYRRDMPINGLLVAVAANELMASGDPVEDARDLRSRLEELITELKIQFPVYLLITKCDLVPGFSDFFGALPRSRREELLGWTNPSWEMEGYVDLLRTALGDFQSRVTELRPALLRDEDDPESLRNIFVFPEQLRNLNEAVVEYCDVLFRETRYNESPFLRGVYFTSALQTGSTIEDIVKGLGLEERPVEGSKSYFLQDFFQERLSTDDRLVTPTGSATTRLRVFNNLGLGLVALTCVLIATFSTASYLRNRTLLNRIGDSIAYADETAELSKAEQADRLRSYWSDLDTLRDRVENPDRLERFGLFQGREALPAAESALLGTYEEVALLPALDEAQSRLDSFAAGEDRVAPGAAIEAAGALAGFVADAAESREKELEVGGESLARLWDTNATESSVSNFAAAYRSYLHDPFRQGDSARLEALEAQRLARRAHVQEGLPRVLNVLTIQTWLQDQGGEIRFPAELVDSNGESARVHPAFTSAQWAKNVQPLVAMVQRMGGEMAETEAASFLQRYRTAYYNTWRDFFGAFELDPSLGSEAFCNGRVDVMEGFELFQTGLRESLGEDSPPPTWVAAATKISRLRNEYASVLERSCMATRDASPCLALGRRPFDAHRAKVSDLCRSLGDPADPGHRDVSARCASVLKRPIDESMKKLMDLCGTRAGSRKAPRRPSGGSLPELENYCGAAGSFWRHCQSEWSLFLNCESCGRKPDSPISNTASMQSQCRKAKDCQGAILRGRSGTVRFHVLPGDGKVVETRLTVLCSREFELVDRNDGRSGTLNWSVDDCADAEIRVTLDDGTNRDVVTLATASGKLGLPNLLLSAQRVGNEFTWDNGQVSATMEVMGADEMTELAKLAR